MFIAPVNLSNDEDDSNENGKKAKGLYAMFTLYQTDFPLSGIV